MELPATRDRQRPQLSTLIYGQDPTNWTGAAASPGVAAITPGLTTITGTSGNDTYYVIRSGSQLWIYENTPPVGAPTYSSELSALGPSLTINTLGGDDTLVVNSGGELSLGVTRLIYNAGTGANSLTLESGSARIDSTAAPGGALDSTIQAGAQLTTSQLVQNGLTLGNNSRLALLPASPTSIITSLSLGTGATLDIADNALVLDYTGASPVATIRGKILSGRGGAGFGETWTGAGITSSAAAQANTIDPESRSVAYAENALLPLGAYASFRGQAVDDTSILIVYTRTADANLDGIINDDDVTIVGATYAPGVANASWALGDFEYNGFADDDDVTLLGAFYNPAANPAPAPLSPGLRPGVEAGIDSKISASFSDNSPPGGAGGYGWREGGTPVKALSGGLSSTDSDDDLLDLLAESIAARAISRAENVTDARVVSAKRIRNAVALWRDASWDETFGIGLLK